MAPNGDNMHRASQSHPHPQQHPHPAPAPSATYLPTDTTIPPHLYHKVPCLALYKLLLDAEHSLDLAVARKALDLQSLHLKAIHPSYVRGVPGTLRIFVYNSCNNQPWQLQLPGLLPVPDPVPDPTWTLRVEGKFIPDAPLLCPLPAPNFSSLISALSIDLIPNDHYPHLAPPLSHIIEWRENIPDPMGKVLLSPFDGLDVTRAGMHDIDAKIALLVRSNSHELALDEPLANFAGKKLASQQDLVYLVWQYVLHRNLLRKGDSLSKVPAVAPPSDLPAVAPLVDPSSAPTAAGPGTADALVAECDDVLRSLFHVDSFQFHHLYHLLLPHYLPREPIVLDYTINTRKSSTIGERVLDIPVTLPADLAAIQADMLSFNKARFENLTQADVAIARTHQKLAVAVATLHSTDMRERFYRDLSADPVAFVEQWLVSQSETLKALKSDEGYDEEVVRRAQYFHENEHLIRDKVNLLLGTGRF